MQEALDELMNLMTIMYMMIQEVLADVDEMGDIETQLRECTVWMQPTDRLMCAKSP